MRAPPIVPHPPSKSRTCAAKGTGTQELPLTPDAGNTAEQLPEAVQRPLVQGAEYFGGILRILIDLSPVA